MVRPLVDSRTDPNTNNSIQPNNDNNAMRLRGKHFPSSKHPTMKSSCACTFQKNVRGNYKRTKISAFCQKCQFFLFKNCFATYHTESIV